MDKRQFLEDLLNKIRDVDVSNIVGKYIQLHRRGRNYLGLCPFHNDNNLGSFVVTSYKGIFKCFSCDTGGDSIKFVAELSGINYVEAAFKIGLDERIITDEEYEEYFSRRRFTKEEIITIEKISIDKTKPVSNIAPISIRDKVYNLFLDSIKLSEEHTKYLTEVRCLSQEIIEERKYKSYPTQSAMDRLIEQMRETVELEEVDDILGRIPGFFQRKIKGEWTWTFPTNKGILIPIRDALGKISGLQIRRDEKDEERGRYIWFSSSFADFSKIFKNGTSSGSPLDVLYPEGKANKVLFITEGRFKSESIVEKFNSISISLQGVSSWKYIDKEIGKIEKKVGFKFSHIYIAFDSDMVYKYQVYDQLKKMSDYLLKEMNFEDRGLKENSTKGIYYMYWGDPKGIDDFLIEIYDEDTDMGRYKFNKDGFDKEYKKNMDSILEDLKMDHPRDIPISTLKKEINPFDWTM